MPEDMSYIEHYDVLYVHYAVTVIIHVVRRKGDTNGEINILV